MAKLPLEGIRILDFSQVWAGPACTSILACLGAYVIKVEGMSRLDISHILLTAENQFTAELWNRGPYYHCHNPGKRGITLDLLQPDGLDLVKRLVPACDVLIEAFSPRVMANFGLTYDILRDLRPDLIMMSMSGYGQTGPYSDYGAYGMGLEPASGIASITGYRESGPTRTGVSFTDPIAGIAGAAAVIMALRYRQRTGQGQYIDMSQQEAAIPFMGASLMECQMTGRTPCPRGNRSSTASPQGCYRCKGDDDWMVISVSDDEEWASFCKAVGHPEWQEDKRFSTMPARHQNHDALDALIEEWTRGYDHIEAFQLLQEARVKAAPVYNGKELLLDPHLRERHHFDVLDHPADLGSRPVARDLIAKFDRMEPKPDRAAPSMGEHNAEVLQGLAGVSDEELADLEARQIIGTAPILEIPPDADLMELLAQLLFPLDRMIEQGSVRTVEPDYREQLGLTDFRSPS
jgi:crotonobetainyl-CoA:carnitine CoA-transferase CaiB-like acyl-CoA transferase